jgi:hypothetical protein
MLICSQTQRRQVQLVCQSVYRFRTDRPGSNGVWIIGCRADPVFICPLPDPLFPALRFWCTVE